MGRRQTATRTTLRARGRLRADTTAALRPAQAKRYAPAQAKRYAPAQAKRYAPGRGAEVSSA